MRVKIDLPLKIRFPDLIVLTARMENVRIETRNAELEQFGKEVVQEIKERYDLESLKDQEIIRAYRDFFWDVGIDPTKHRPAAEALIRRVLRGSTLPNINTLVDAYNLASMKTEVALAAFDAERIKGDLLMRFAKENEKFVGIGMEKPLSLQGGEVVISDAEKIVAIYPHRDADSSRITLTTRNILLMSCGVPSVDERILRNATEMARKYMLRFCGGQVVKP